MDTFDYSTAPIGTVVAVKVITHCPSCSTEFGPENLGTLNPETRELTCGPCIGQEPRR